MPSGEDASRVPSVQRRGSSELAEGKALREKFQFLRLASSHAGLDHFGFCSVDVQIGRLVASQRKEAYVASIPGSTPHYESRHSETTMMFPSFSNDSPEFRSLVHENLFDPDIQQRMQKVDTFTGHSPSKPMLVPQDVSNSLYHAVSMAICGIADPSLHFKVGVQEALESPNCSYLIRQRWEAMKRRLGANGPSNELLQALHDPEWTPSLLAFILANLIRRPIVVYALAEVQETRNSTVSGLSGIYLPLCWAASQCSKEPLTLIFDRGFYHPLVGVKGTPGAEDTVSLFLKQGELLPVPFCLDEELDKDMMIRYTRITWITALWKEHPIKLPVASRAAVAIEEEVSYLMDQYYCQLRAQALTRMRSDDKEPFVSLNERYIQEFMTAIRAPHSVSVKALRKALSRGKSQEHGPTVPGRVPVTGDTGASHADATQVQVPDGSTQGAEISSKQPLKIAKSVSFASQLEEVRLLVCDPQPSRHRAKEKKASTGLFAAFSGSLSTVAGWKKKQRRSSLCSSVGEKDAGAAQLLSNVKSQNAGPRRRHSLNGEYSAANLEADILASTVQSSFSSLNLQKTNEDSTAADPAQLGPHSSLAGLGLSLSFSDIDQEDQEDKAKLRVLSSNLCQSADFAGWSSSVNHNAERSHDKGVQPPGSLGWLCEQTRDRQFDLGPKFSQPSASVEQQLAWLAQTAPAKSHQARKSISSFNRDTLQDSNPKISRASSGSGGLSSASVPSSTRSSGAKDKMQRPLSTSESRKSSPKKGGVIVRRPVSTERNRQKSARSDSSCDQLTNRSMSERANRPGNGFIVHQLSTPTTIGAVPKVQNTGFMIGRPDKKSKESRSFSDLFRQS